MKLIKYLFLIFLFIHLGLKSYAIRDSCSGILNVRSHLVQGVRPNTPFLYRIPICGQRPIVWNIKGLPEGLVFDTSKEIIKGKVSKEGEYNIDCSITNSFGKEKFRLTIIVGDKLALTPPMGWSSWNSIGENISEKVVLESAHAMINSGMATLGYNYINIDDFWQLEDRDEKGHLIVDPQKFPNGIKYLTDSLHAMGLKLGLYSDAASHTCGGVAGSYKYEYIDCADFAEWGIDLLKYDYCNAPDSKDSAIIRYKTMADGLKNSGRSIVFNVCEWGQREPWIWAKEIGAQYWRTTWDIRDKWKSEKYFNGDNGILNIVNVNSKLSEFAEPGAWNDPDILVVGLFGKSPVINDGDPNVGCTLEQYRSHMSLWCMMSAPLMCGNDIREMDSFVEEILMNEKAIAIDQDPLGIQGELIKEKDGVQFWIKPLENGANAVAVVNTTAQSKNSTITWADFGIDLPIKSISSVWDNSRYRKITMDLSVVLHKYETKLYVVKN